MLICWIYRLPMFSSSKNIRYVKYVVNVIPNYVVTMYFWSNINTSDMSFSENLPCLKTHVDVHLVGFGYLTYPLKNGVKTKIMIYVVHEEICKFCGIILSIIQVNFV